MFEVKVKVSRASLSIAGERKTDSCLVVDTYIVTGLSRNVSFGYPLLANSSSLRAAHMAYQLPSPNALLQRIGTETVLPVDIQTSAGRHKSNLTLLVDGSIAGQTITPVASADFVLERRWVYRLKRFADETAPAVPAEQERGTGQAGKKTVVTWHDLGLVWHGT